MSEHVQRVVDALLVVRFQAGEDAALDELVRRHDQRVRGAVLQWLGGNASVVDDISQEIWMQVFKGLGKLDRPMAWEAWLMRIARTPQSPEADRAGLRVSRGRPGSVARRARHC